MNLARPFNFSHYATYGLLPLLVLWLTTALAAANADGPTTNPPAVSNRSEPASPLTSPTNELRIAKPPPKVDFSAFNILNERNIFDPNRSPRRSNSQRAKPRTVESFGLVGVMSYEKGNFAFFDGSSSEFKKALKPSDAIAGYRLVEVRPASVLLAAGTNELELKVGSQMRREDEGEWNSVSQPQTYAATSEPGSSNKEPSLTTDATPSSAGAESDILKKMMQRREQE